MLVAGMVRGLAGLFWFAVLAAVGWFAFSVNRRQPTRTPVVALIIVLVAALVLTTLGAGLVFIQPDQRGVVISAVAPLGYRPQALQPGLHFIIPYVEHVQTYSISRQTYTLSISETRTGEIADEPVFARTSDGQEVYIDASVIFALDPEHVTDIHINWQDRYTNGLIRPETRGIIREAAANYGIEEVYSTRRAELSTQIEEGLREELSKEGLLLVDFVLRNITFTDEYADAIERKQIAEQDALRAAFLVRQQEQEAERVRVEAKGQKDATITRSEGDAQATVIRARADAQALQLIAGALRDNPDLLTYQYITKLSPNVGVIMLPSETPFLLDLKSLGVTGTPSLTPGSVLTPTAGTP